MAAGPGTTGGVRRQAPVALGVGSLADDGDVGVRRAERGDQSVDVAADTTTVGRYRGGVHEYSWHHALLIFLVGRSFFAAARSPVAWDWFSSSCRQPARPRRLSGVRAAPPAVTVRLPAPGRTWQSATPVDV